MLKTEVDGVFASLRGSKLSWGKRGRQSILPGMSEVIMRESYTPDGRRILETEMTIDEYITYQASQNLNQIIIPAPVVSTAPLLDSQPTVSLDATQLFVPSPLLDSQAFLNSAVPIRSVKFFSR